LRILCCIGVCYRGEGGYAPPTLGEIPAVGLGFVGFVGFSG
jgi:hypothetical protein